MTPSLSPSNEPSESPSAEPSAAPSSAPSTLAPVSPAPAPSVSFSVVFKLYDSGIESQTLIPPSAAFSPGATKTICVEQVPPNFGEQMEFYWNALLVFIDVTAPFCLAGDKNTPASQIATAGAGNLQVRPLDGLGAPIGVSSDSIGLVFFARRRALASANGKTTHQLNASSTTSNRFLQTELDLHHSPGRGTLLAGMLNSNFHGASGLVRFGQGQHKKGRNSDDIMVGLYNIHPKPLNNETGKRSYSAILTSVYTEDQGWQDIPGAVIVNRDGTTTTS